MIYELGQVPETTATVLAQVLALDAGHLSRVLAALGASGIVARRRSPDDGRRQMLSLTAAGRAAFAELDRRSAEQAAALLERLPPDAQTRLLGAMAVIEELLGDGEPPSLVLRQPLPGEYGWVIQRHGALYAREHGFDTSFEALVAKIVAEFAHDHDPARERAWIAALDGDPVGSIFCVDAGDGRREAAPAPGRARRARSPRRQAARRRVHPLRPRRRLPRADACGRRAASRPRAASMPARASSSRRPSRRARSSVRRTPRRPGAWSCDPTSRP